MNNSILSQLNSPFLYLVCGVIIAYVAVVCLIFMVRAYQAGKKAGIEEAKMKRVLTFSATFTVLPSLGILLGVIALSGSLGVPWPWLRLSVIGALHYETQVAQVAAEQIGMSSLSASEMTAGNFTTIALMMSFGIIWGSILSILFNKSYLQKLQRKPKKETSEKSGKGFGDMAMSAMFIGLVSAYIGSYISGYLTKRSGLTPIITSAVSALTMALFLYLIEKKNMKWLEGFSVAASMLAGMAAAVVAGGI